MMGENRIQTHAKNGRQENVNRSERDMALLREICRSASTSEEGGGGGGGSLPAQLSIIVPIASEQIQGGREGSLRE